MSEDVGNRLHWLDWVVFAIMLLISMGIGIYHSLAGGRQRTNTEYLLGNRQMHLLPVTVSLAVSYTSTLTMLGIPAEVYSFGVQWWMGIWGGMLGAVLACIVFVPLFFPLKLTSVNEYLELRFESNVVKCIGTFCSVLGAVIYTGSVFYGPCTAIEAVSGLSVHICIIIGGVVCLIYTTLGGIKAVIWSDVFQSTIMLFGCLAVLIRGMMLIGSLETVWNLNDQWNRLVFFDFDPDPTKRINFYGAIFGNGLSWLGILGYLQTGVQRYSSLPTLNQAKLTVLLAMPGMILLQSISCFIGLIVFAYYAKINCDPLNEGSISSVNQILPHFIADVGGVPLLNGLFISSLSAASLSSASSALNASAANLWVDILKPSLPDFKKETEALITKCIVVVCGILGVLIAVIMVEVGGTMLQVAATFSAAAGGPAQGLYLLGAFVPWVNWKGVSAGGIIGMAYGAWVAIGSFSVEKQWAPLPTPEANCSLNAFDGYNMTTPVWMTASDLQTTPDSSLSILERMYSVSFLWMREVNTTVTVVAAIIISFLTGHRKPSDVESKYMHPLMSKIFNLKKSEAPNKVQDDKEKTLELSDSTQDDPPKYNLTSL